MTRPFLHIETHLWVRPLSRLLRVISRNPGFGWFGEPSPETETTMGGFPRESLPAVYCRHCGRSGWAALSPEKDPQELMQDPAKIYRASVSSKRLVRPLIAATDEEVAAGAIGRPGAVTVLMLNPEGTRVRPLDPARDLGTAVADVPVLGDLRHDRDGVYAAEHDRCPACGMDDGTRFLGAGLASLASVAITELFTGGQLADPQRKTLLFNDAVQDAAHRAGFVASRSYSFSLRTLVAAILHDGGGEANLNDLIADVITKASAPQWLTTVVPPDLHGRQDVDRLLAGENSGSKDTWELIARRLAFQMVLEFGLRSRMGRTLELTRTAAVEVPLADPGRIAALAKDLQLRGPVTAMGELPGPDRYVVLVRGILERLRMSGGVSHHWLENWLAMAGTKRFGAIWGRRPDGMPAFPSGVSAPRFLTGQRRRGSEFDAADTRQGWYVDWTARCLGIGAQEATGYLPRLLQLLADEDVLAARTASDGATQVYGLRPGHVRVRLLDAAEVPGATLGCDTCHWHQVVSRRNGARTGSASRAPGTGAPGRSPRRPTGSTRRTITVSCTRSGIRTRWSPPSTSARCPGPSGSGWSVPSATAAGTTTRTSCPARPPWNSASTSASCPRSSSPRCHAARPATCSVLAVRGGAPGTRSWSPSPGAGNVSSTSSPNPVT